MDLTAYYKRLRDVEGAIKEPFPIVVSLDTPDGGKAGALTETPRWLAARMIAQGQAKLASADEAKAFRDALVEAQRKVEQDAAAAKVQFAVLTPAELSKLKGAGKASKD
ncbi:MAG: hypothetical protein ABSC23_08695 [Bryobacteraceae bacterium]|jgi:hypothetical protein